MKTKKFYTVNEIANLMKCRDTIDKHEKEFKEQFKDDKHICELDHKMCEESRQKLAWIFDLDIDILLKARGIMKGDKTINGNEKFYIK